jgi:hypothetical protein
MGKVLRAVERRVVRDAGALCAGISCWPRGDGARARNIGNIHSLRGLRSASTGCTGGCPARPHRGRREAPVRGREAAAANPRHQPSWRGQRLSSVARLNDAGPSHIRSRRAATGNPPATASPLPPPHQPKPLSVTLPNSTRGRVATHTIALGAIDDSERRAARDLCVGLPAPVVAVERLSSRAPAPSGYPSPGRGC